MNRKGFTLVEILAVIAIIGILSLLIVPNVIESYRESVKHAMKTQENEVVDAAELFVEDYCRHPLSQYKGQCSIYSLSTSVSDKKYTCLSTLQNTKYIDEIVSQGAHCVSFAIYNEDYSNFKSYLQCGDKYQTQGINDFKDSNGLNIIDNCGGDIIPVTPDPVTPDPITPDPTPQPSNTSNIKIDIARADYNTFAWTITSSQEVMGYNITNSNTVPTNWITTGSLTSGSYDINTANVWYVWVKDSLGSTSSSSISSYTISRNQAVGTVLTTKYDYTSPTSQGTSFTNPTVMLAGTPVYVSSTLSTGYLGNIILKHGNTTMTSGSVFNVHASETISTSAPILANYGEFNGNNLVSSYETLYAAFSSAVSGHTIKPLAASITDASTSDPTIASGKTLTLDLNGYTIHMSREIKNNGNLYIGGSGEIKTTPSSNINLLTNSGNGTLKIVGGNISNSNQGLAINNTSSGTVRIEGGKVSSNDDFAVNNTGSGRIDITGGEISSGIAETAYAVLNNSTSTLNVSGGIIKAIRNNGSLTITGGKIQSARGSSKIIDNYGNTNISGTNVVLEVYSSPVNAVPISNASSATLTMSNMTLGCVKNSSTFGYNIVSSYGTLRMNNVTISNWENNEDYCVAIRAGSSNEITNTRFNNGSSGGNVFRVLGSASASFSGNNITTAGRAVGGFDSANITILSGTYESTNRNTFAHSSTGTFKLLGGTVKQTSGSNYAILHKSSGTFIIGEKTSRDATNPNIYGASGGVSDCSSGKTYIYSGKINGSVFPAYAHNYMSNSEYATGEAIIGQPDQNVSEVPTLTSSGSAVSIQQKVTGKISIISGLVQSTKGHAVGIYDTSNISELIIGKNTAGAERTSPTIVGDNRGIDITTDVSVKIYSGRIVGQNAAGIYSTSTANRKITLGRGTDFAFVATSPIIVGKTYGIRFSDSSVKLGTYNSGKIMGKDGYFNGTFGTLRSGYSLKTITDTEGNEYIPSGTYKEVYLKAN